MAGAFTVRAGVLRSGSGEVAGLQRESESLGGQVARTLTGLAQAAGGGELSAALERMAGTGMQRFLDATAVYQHMSQGLSQTADRYDQAEADIARQAERARGGGAG